MTRHRAALVLAAHADDETLACGGTVAKLAAEGWTIDIVVLTDGIVTARPGGTQDNRAYATTACSLLGVGAPAFLDFPDQYLDGVPMADLSNAVLALDLQPDLVIGHSAHDLNRDHRIAAEVARIISRPKDRPIALLATENPADNAWNGRAFEANYYVDISSTIERKVAAFAAYGNEVRPGSGPRSLDGIRLLAQYHGMNAGLAVAEAFTLVRGVEGLLP